MGFDGNLPSSHTLLIRPGGHVWIMDFLIYIMNILINGYKYKKWNE